MRRNHFSVLLHSYRSLDDHCSSVSTLSIRCIDHIMMFLSFGMFHCLNIRVCRYLKAASWSGLISLMPHVPKTVLASDRLVPEHNTHTSVLFLDICVTLRCASSTDPRVHYYFHRMRHNNNFLNSSRISFCISVRSLMPGRGSNEALVAISVSIRL